MFTGLSPIYAAEYLEPINSDRILIDGDLSDWRHIRRHSAEYLLKGILADLEDFQGGVKVAFNSQWLYIALDCSDSDLVKNRLRGDYVKLTLSGINRSEAAELTFSFPKESATREARRGSGGSDQSILKSRSDTTHDTRINVTLNGKVVSIGGVKARVGRRSYTVEAKLPMSMIPWAYGNEVKLAVIFEDVDRDESDSTYATHLIGADGRASDVSYIFGGPQIYKELYSQQVQSFQLIREIKHQWVGDHREELIMITDSEIALFGDGVSREGGIVRYIHGWPKPEMIRARVEGVGLTSRIVIQHLKQDGSVRRTERFRLEAGQLISE